LNKYFGTDGIRGRVGIAPITADFLLKLGWAVGSVLSEKGQASVVIGKDTRVSGYLFESALEAGFLSAGVNVGLLGPMPTPGIAYLTQAYAATAGVVISASHNHFEDNGVKFFSKSGLKLSDKDHKAIEKKLEEPMVSVDTKNIGKAIRHDQAIGRYIEFCKSTFDRSIDLLGVTMVVDCANGATYHIAQSVFAELGAEVIMINNKPDGYNINLNCGATDTKHLQREVLKHEADLGIAFDGDGDRMVMVDHQGELVDGDELVFIIAKAWHSISDLKSDTVVGTQMSNLGMRQALSSLGIQFIEAKVGDRFVMEKIKLHNAALGGEGSGHIICLDKSSSGDGIISALQVLEVVCKSDKTLCDLKNEMIKYPQVLINVKTAGKIDLESHTELNKTIKAVESELGEEGRVLIRASGTEPLIRVMVEASDMSMAESGAKKLAASL
jgi:phosphoglucosamine mutase